MAQKEHLGEAVRQSDADPLVGFAGSLAGVPSERYLLPAGGRMKRRHRDMACS